MILLIGGEKGGTGKTTVATNLAALRALAGNDVLLIDTDRQSSALHWSQRRGEGGHVPRVACVQIFGKGLATEVRDLAGRYDDLVIDAGGRDSVELRGALVVADRAFIPIQASQFDVWTLDRQEELIATAAGFNPELTAYVVVNRASPNPQVSEAAELGELLGDFDHLALANTIIRDRITFRKAAREGLAVAELKPQDTKAAREVSALYEEVFSP